MKPSTPEGFTVRKVKTNKGKDLIVAISKKSYNLPKIWNGKKWVPGLNLVQSVR